MKLSNKITLWQNAGIITQQQGNAILCFEKENSKPYALLGFLLFAVFCIALGTISIIAANWEFIPARLKLIADFTLLAGVGGLTYYAAYKKRNIAFEVLLFLFAISVLATIGLIGQVYQLQPSEISPFLLWSLLTFPLLFVTQKPLLPLIMLPVFSVSFGYYIAENKITGDILQQMIYSWQYSVFVLWLFIWMIIWQLCTIFASGKFCGFVKALKFWLIVYAGILVFAIDVSVNIAEITPLSNSGLGEITAVLITVALGLAATASYLSFSGSKNYLIPCVMALIIAGSFINSGAALSFAVLLLCALYAWRAGNVKLLNTVLVFAGIRVFWLYADIFDNLLFTGLGMISAGVLLLVLIFGAVKLNKYLKEKK